MTTVIQMLERLANTKSTKQYRQTMAGFATTSRRDFEMTRAIYCLKEITRFNGRGRKRR